MKRILFIITSIVLSLGFLVGCQNNEEDNVTAENDIATEVNEVSEVNNDIVNDDEKDSTDVPIDSNGDVGDNKDELDEDAMIAILEKEYLRIIEKTLEAVYDSIEGFSSIESTNIDDWLQDAKLEFGKIQEIGFLMKRMEDDNFVPIKFIESHKDLTDGVLTISVGGNMVVEGVEDEHNKDMISKGMDVMREGVNIISVGRNKLDNAR